MRSTAQVLLATLAAHHANQGTKQITLAFQMAFQPENKTRIFFLNHYLESSVQITPAHQLQGDDTLLRLPLGLSLTEFRVSLVGDFRRTTYFESGRERVRRNPRLCAQTK